MIGASRCARAGRAGVDRGERRDGDSKFMHVISSPAAKSMHVSAGLLVACPLRSGVDTHYLRFLRSDARGDNSCDMEHRRQSLIR